MNQESIKKQARLVKQTGLHHDLQVFHIETESFPAETRIIESDSAMEILLSPWIVGSKLGNLAREASIDFLRVAFETCPEIQDSNLESLTEVVPLAGALYYSIAEACESVFGETINRCFIGAKRQLTHTGWVTELAYMNFEAMSSSPVILIGDTIATGGTIERIIEATLEHTSDVRAIIVYSIAGGSIGAIRLKKIAEKIDVPLYLFYSNAIFGVEDNGTDMPWLHPGTICSEETRQRALDVYGPDLGRRWCSIWDWGDRAKHPLKHLEELLERCERELSSSLTDLTREVLLSIQKRAQIDLDKWLGRVKLK